VQHKPRYNLQRYNSGESSKGIGDRSISPGSSCLPRLLGWNPSFSSFNRSSCLPCLLGWNPSLSSFNSKFHLLLTEVSVQGAPVSLACWVGIPVYLVLIFHLLLTEVSVQGAPVSLACWVGIPVYLVLIVSFIYY
ncbi:unnamed protein product, partial [Porites evermanni]